MSRDQVGGSDDRGYHALLSESRKRLNIAGTQRDEGVDRSATQTAACMHYFSGDDQYSLIAQALAELTSTLSTIYQRWAERNRVWLWRRSVQLGVKKLLSPALPRGNFVICEQVRALWYPRPYFLFFLSQVIPLSLWRICTISRSRAVSRKQG